MANIEVLDPLTGSALHEIESMTVADVEHHFEIGRNAQRAWAKVPAGQRSKFAFKLHDILLAKQDQVMDLLQKETGKSRSHAFEEIAGALGSIRYYAKISPKALKRTRAKGGVPGLISTYVDRVPVGVVGVITPWNYPLALTMMDVIPALLAGNAVVQKADNQTALTTKLAAQLA